jgi:hypothetical protein
MDNSINTTIPNDVKQVYSRLAKAQAEFKIIIKNKVAKVGSYSYRYADLAECLSAVKDALAKYELAVTQNVVLVDSQYWLQTMLHYGNETVYSHVPLIMPDKPTPPSLGSALTYSRRYGLCGLLNVVGEEDDDGAMATGKSAPQTNVTHIKPIQEVYTKPMPEPVPQPEFHPGDAFEDEFQVKDMGKEPASDKQKAAIHRMIGYKRKMIKEWNWQSFLKRWGIALDEKGNYHLGEIGKMEASEIIEALTKQ